MAAAVSFDEFMIAWFVSGTQRDAAGPAARYAAGPGQPAHQRRRVASVRGQHHARSAGAVAKRAPRLQRRQAGKRRMSVLMLELDRLAKHFGRQVAVADVSLSVEKGEFVALMGPSRLRQDDAVAHDCRPGQADRGGNPAVGTADQRGRALAPRRSAGLAELRAVPVSQRAQERRVWAQAARRCRPRRAARRPPNGWSASASARWASESTTQLSGGQRQRVALARALVTEPEMLLLDEPLSALDPHLQVRMQSELVRLHRELGITFICVTHSQSEAFAMASRVVILNEGRVQQVGAPQDIFRRSANRIRRGIRWLQQHHRGNRQRRGRLRPRVGVGARGDLHGRRRCRPGAWGARLSHRPGRPHRASRGAAAATATRSRRTSRLSNSSGLLSPFSSRPPTGANCRTQRPLQDIERMAVAVGQPVVARWSPAHGYLLEI